MNEEQLQKIERLSQLLKDGAITQSEFDQQKAAVLGNQPSDPLKHIEPQSDGRKATGCYWLLGLFGVIFIVSIITDKVKSPAVDT